MATPHEQILALTLIPAAATIFGGAIAVWRTPSETVRSVIQHFAAGVVLAAVAGELLPEMTREHQPLGVVIGFILGVALMLCVKLVAERVEAREVQETPLITVAFFAGFVSLYLLELMA